MLLPPGASRQHLTTKGNPSCYDLPSPPCTVGPIVLPLSKGSEDRCYGQFLPQMPPSLPRHRATPQALEHTLPNPGPPGPRQCQGTDPPC